MTTADWTPAVDIAETADEYLINVELTEVSKDDVKISAREGVLTIEGQRKVEQPAGLNYHRLERGHGTFARRFTLPEDVELKEYAPSTARACSICTCLSTRSRRPRRSILKCNRPSRNHRADTQHRRQFSLPQAVGDDAGSSAYKIANLLITIRCLNDLTGLFVLQPR
jgi:HSP20 family protein